MHADMHVRRTFVPYRVSVPQLNRQAHVAFGAVEESVATTDPAYAATVAMVLILILVVEEIALEARVLAEPTVAILTRGLHRLTGVAEDAYQLRHFLPVHHVRLLLVVAKPACVHLVATRSLRMKQARHFA